MKKAIIFWGLLAAAGLAGCSEPESPEEELKSYIEAWEQGEYKKMYALFTEETKQQISETEFTNKYGKVIEDIEMGNYDVELPEEKDVQKDNEETARLSFAVEAETVAGPVSFEKEAIMKLEETEEGEAWRIDWEPSYLLPGYEESDKVRIQILEAERGRIFDRNDSVLASNGTAVEIGVHAGAITEEGKEAAAAALAITAEEIDEKLSQSWVQDGYFVPLQTVAESNTATIQKATAVQGITTKAVPARVYPYKEAAAHLTGYVGEVTAEEIEKNKAYRAGDRIGKRGLEQLFEEQLKETDGVQIFLEKEKGEDQIVARKNPENGQDIKIAVDAEMQKLLFEKMGGAAGTAAAINPKNGDVLALVSSPAFDPNAFVLGLSNQQYAALEANPEKPLLNRFASLYSPGSAIKPITAAAAMSAEALDPLAGKTIKGLQWQKDASWGSYRVTRVAESADPVTLKSALIASDNIYFAMAALDTGAEKMKNQLESFGFGADFPFPYPIQPSQISNSGSFDSEILLADTGYGQGEVLVSMSHLASAYSAFIQNGTIMKPRLLLSEPEQAWKTGMVSAEQAAIIQQGLRGVVEEGTAQAADLEGMEISGKTGTAEIKEKQGTTGTENGVFVSYKASEPDLILALLVENVENSGGSKAAVEKAASFYREWP